MAAKSYKIPFDVLVWGGVDKDNASPVLDVKIGSKSYRFLIDTGASLCFIDREICMQHRGLVKNIVSGDDVDISLSLIGESKTISKYVSQAFMKVGEHGFHQNLYLMDLGDDAKYYAGVLGFNFLYRHKINLNLSKLYLNFKK